jgi:tetratricopeptide (TPR) repeat protein
VNGRDRTSLGWRLAAVVAVAAVLTLALVSCGSDVQTGASAPPDSASRPAPVDRQTLRAVSLPELSKLDAPVQQQLRDGYAALTAKTGNPATSDADLGFGYGEMGKLLMAAEFRDAAEPAFLNAEALAPNERRWPYYLAHLYKLKGDAARSTAAFERALKAKPDDLATLVWLGGAYLDAGRAGDAEPLFATAFSIAPRSVPVLFGLGRTALARQDYPRAVDYLEQALAIDPKAVVIHFPLAMAYRGMGDVPKAEAHLRVRGPGDIRPPDPLMQELDSLLESAVAYEVRGAQALDESNWVAAAEYFRKGVALAPNEPSLRHKLGTALAMSGDPHAVEQFEEVTRRWPKFTKAQYSLGLILASSGRTREAIEHFSAAVKADPGYSEARLQLAEALRTSGRLQESLPQYQETITLNPRLAEARLGYAMALAGLKRVDDARKELSEGAKVFPDRREFAEGLRSLPPTGPGR